MLGIIAAIAMSSNWSVTDLSWMRGSWQCEIWGGTFEEHWTAPNAGTMLAAGRHMKGGKTEFMEFLSIEPAEGGLTMWILLGTPSRGPKNGVPFKLTKLQAKEAWFENPRNDMPSKIIYRATDYGLLCRLEGIENGKPEAQEFKFKAIK